MMKKSEKRFLEEKSKKLVEKRNWISPELSVWSAKNLELGLGKFSDGFNFSYGP